MGLAAAFSFYPGKNLGACGEAGAITTNDEKLAQKMRMIRDHGQAKKYYHDVEGYNGRLDSIQAGWLSVKLRHLAKWNESRRMLAHAYHKLLEDLKGAVVLPIEAPFTKGVYHLYVIRLQDREALQAHLAEMGIGTGIHYPIPLHLQKAYQHLGYKQGDFPVTEKVASEIVSLPMFPQLTAEQQKLVAESVAIFVNSKLATTR
jgi:dTDP-4-amino-4,6-dideoxygalactose transaminase